MGEMGGFGGGLPEHPRQWRGSQWLSLALGVPSYPDTSAFPEEVREPSWGSAQAAL